MPFNQQRLITHMVDKGLVDSCSFVITVRAVAVVCACVRESLQVSASLSPCVCGMIGNQCSPFWLLYFSDFHSSCYRTIVEKGKLSTTGCLLQYRWPWLYWQVFPLTQSYSDILCVINIVGVQNTGLIKWHLFGFVGFLNRITLKFLLHYLNRWDSICRCSIPK